MWEQGKHVGKTSSLVEAVKAFAPKFMPKKISVLFGNPIKGFRAWSAIQRASARITAEAGGFKKWTAKFSVSKGGRVEFYDFQHIE